MSRPVVVGCRGGQSSIVSFEAAKKSDGTCGTNLRPKERILDFHQNFSLIQVESKNLIKQNKTKKQVAAEMIVNKIIQMDPNWL